MQRPLRPRWPLGSARQTLRPLSRRAGLPLRPSSRCRSRSPHRPQRRLKAVINQSRRYVHSRIAHPPCHPPRPPSEPALSASQRALSSRQRQLPAVAAPGSGITPTLGARLLWAGGGPPPVALSALHGCLAARNTQGLHPPVTPSACLARGRLLASCSPRLPGCFMRQRPFPLSAARPTYTLLQVPPQHHLPPPDSADVMAMHLYSGEDRPSSVGNYTRRGHIDRIFIESASECTQTPGGRRSLGQLITILPPTAGPHMGQ